MIRSMTGFGRGAVLVDGRRFVVEVRSVNGRGLDLKVRARELDAAAELEVGRAVRSSLERGSVVVTVAEETASSSGLDERRIRGAHAALEALRRELGLAQPVDLATVAAFLTGSVSAGQAEGPSWDGLRPAVEQALAALDQMRTREGAALAEDLGRRLARISELSARVGELAAGLPTRAGRRLEDRLAALTAAGSVDPARLAQEIALLADRLDVSEELVRLRTHLAHFSTLLAATAGAVGRKMDFVVQEIGRELNTIGSKVQDADIAALIIDGKAELEKIREQAQNIE